MTDRPLSPLEQSFFRITEAGSLNVVTLARVEGPLDPERLRAAVYAAAARHPLLRVRVTEDERFVNGAPPPPFRVVATELVAAVEELLNARLDWRTGPLLRVDVVPEAGGFWLLPCMHHAVTDGKSGCFFARDVLLAYGALLDGRSAKLEPLPPRPPLTATLPVKGPAQWWKNLAFLARQGLGSLGPRTVRAPEDSPARPYRTALYPLRLDSTFTEALATRARAEGTSVHGALCAALLQAIAAEVPARKEPFRMGCLSPVDVRADLVPPAGEAVGVYVLGVTTRHDVTPDGDLWALARDVKGALELQRARGDVLTLGAVQDWLPLPRDPARLAAQLTNVLDVTGTVTNLGRLELALPEGPVRLVDLGFAAAGNAFPGSSAGLMVTTWQGAMRISLVTGDTAFSAARSEAMLARLHARLHAAISG